MNTPQKKNLPLVATPTVATTLPVSKTKIKYRPFVVKEQKAMLIAQASSDPETISETLKSVIESCTFGTLEYDKTPIADLAYFFLQLRIASVGPEVKFGVICDFCEKENIINMMLDQVTINTESINDTIMISDEVGMKFRFPSITDTFAKSDSTDKTIKLMYDLLIHVFDQEQLYTKEDFSPQEFQEWVEELSDSALYKIKEWIENIPELTYPLNYRCHHCQQENRKLLGGLHNFFRIGNDT